MKLHVQLMTRKETNTEKMFIMALISGDCTYKLTWLYHVCKRYIDRPSVLFNQKCSH